MELNESSSTSKGAIVSKEQRIMRLENPFTLKVGQVFTGFGIGCGIGIGVGRPLNLGAIPVLNQVMSATRGATDAFSGVGRHVNSILTKFGAKNIEAGVGCGVGFGHGFGVGLAVKPGVVHQIQSCVVQAVTQIMMKFGLAPNLSFGQGALSTRMQNVVNTRNESLNQNSVGNIMQLATKLPDQTSQGIPTDESSNKFSLLESFSSKSSGLNASYGSRTEKVISNFLQNQLLIDEDGELNEQVGRLRSENKMLQMVLNHQQIIEELVEQNEKLRHILVEDLKIPPSKLQGRYSIRNKSSCSECFECRRKQRRR